MFPSLPILSALLLLFPSPLLSVPLPFIVFPFSFYFIFLLPLRMHDRYSILALILSYIRFNLTLFVSLSFTRNVRADYAGQSIILFLWLLGVKEYVMQLCFSLSYQQISDIYISPPHLLSLSDFEVSIFFGMDYCCYPRHPISHCIFLSRFLLLLMIL